MIDNKDQKNKIYKRNINAIKEGISLQSFDNNVTTRSFDKSKSDKCLNINTTENNSPRNTCG